MAESNLRHRTKFVLAEFFVIVLGVLVALAVDEFRAERADDALEIEYGRRLIADLETDSTYFAEFRTILETKARVLRWLLAAPDSLVGFEDPVETMAAVVYSTFVGLPQASRATFEELQSTGRLGLLESREIRSALGVHFSSYARITDILDDRFGDYREMVFAALPGVLQFESRLNPEIVDGEALRTGLRRLANLEGVESAANAELAYTGSLIFYLAEAQGQTTALLHQLRGAY